jgi:hypothetical protein
MHLRQPIASSAFAIWNKLRGYASLIQSTTKYISTTPSALTYHHSNETSTILHSSTFYHRLIALC